MILWGQSIVGKLANGMYEHIDITKDPMALGQSMAQGWGKQKKHGKSCYEWLEPGITIRKHQLRPGVYACKVMLIVYGKEWSVSWYIHDGPEGRHLDGVTIVGWPDEDTLSRILSLADEPGLKEGYQLQQAWLAKHPMYRSFLPGVKSSKRDDPRGYMTLSA